MARALLEKITRLNYSKQFGRHSELCVLDLIHFPFYFGHTKTTENIDV